MTQKPQPPRLVDTKRLRDAEQGHPEERSNARQGEKSKQRYFVRVLVVVDVTFIRSKKLRDTTVEETQETDSLEYSLAFSHNSYSYPLTLLVL